MPILRLHLDDLVYYLVPQLGGSHGRHQVKDIPRERPSYGFSRVGDGIEVVSSLNRYRVSASPIAYARRRDVRTSRATTTLPPARPINMCVI